MENKKLKRVQENQVVFEEYFKEDLDAIEDELKKSKEYSAIIDSELEKLSTPTLGGGKGSQHYLIEHITNAVQLQTQRQGLRRDRFNIKKAIMDYSSKFLDKEENVDENIAELLNNFIKKSSENVITTIKEDPSEVDDSDLDKEIDNLLNDD